jgi:hypothetical protein
MKTTAKKEKPLPILSVLKMSHTKQTRKEIIVQSRRRSQKKVENAAQVPQAKKKAAKRSRISIPIQYMMVVLLWFWSYQI